MHAYIYICICIHIHIYKYTFTFVFMYMCIYSFIHIYMYTYKMCFILCCLMSACVCVRGEKEKESLFFRFFIFCVVRVSVLVPNMFSLMSAGVRVCLNVCVFVC